MEDKNFDFGTASKFIELVKKNHGIDKPNDQMTDGEIRLVVRTIVNDCASPILEDGKQTDYGAFGIDLMLTLALHFWPKFYQKF